VKPGQPLSPRRVAAEVVDAYSSRWLLLVFAAVVVLLPQSLADAFLDGFQIEGVHSPRDAIIVAAAPITVAVSLGGQALYTGFAAAAVVEGRGDMTMPGPMVLARSLPLGRLIAVDILISVGAAIGFTLLVVPGLVFLAYFGIAPAMIKIEHLGVEDSLRRSADLVRGQFWRVLAIMVGVIVVSEVGVQAIATPFHGIAALTLVDLAAEALIMPIEGLTVVVVALNLMERRGDALAPHELASALTSSAK
jgi:hypothetical protein